MVESLAVERPKIRSLGGHNSGGTRGVVEQSELTEGLTWNVVFQVGRLLTGSHNSAASQLSGLDDVEDITIFALFDDLVARLVSHFLHGAKDDIELSRVEVAEHECLAEASSQS